jgi:hypothetical protein
MIYAFENLKEFDEKLVKACEPYIDFSYSFTDRMYYWQRHHLIIDGKDIYKLRLHKAENLKQGFICTDFDEAKLLSMLIEGTDTGVKLKNENLWLEDYLEEKKETTFIKTIALPVSEFIKYYANDFDMLKLLDFEEIISFRNK